MDDITKLTIGLFLFAAAQVWIQLRSEVTRRRERREDLEEQEDRAFHFVWAEHFRVDSLARRLETSDLVELTILGVLTPETAMPRDSAKLTEALSMLGREAGFLGGVAGTLASDLSRQIATYVGSVRAFATELPETAPQLDSVRVAFVHSNYDQALAPWEASIRKSCRELSALLWDAASHSPRTTVERNWRFSGTMHSQIGQEAAKAFEAGSTKKEDAGS